MALSTPFPMTSFNTLKFRFYCLACSPLNTAQYTRYLIPVNSMGLTHVVDGASPSLLSRSAPSIPTPHGWTGMRAGRRSRTSHTSEDSNPVVRIGSP